MISIILCTAVCVVIYTNMIIGPSHRQRAVFGPPRVDPPTKHIIEADDGKLHPLTKVGEFTIARLRLNRPQLISHRIQRQNLTDEDALLRQLKSYLSLYEHLTKQQQLLIEEQQQLLKAQQDLINQIIDLS